MQKHLLVLTVGLLLAACDAPPSLQKSADCAVNVTFGGGSVEINTCGDHADIEVLHVDGSRSRMESSDDSISVPQRAKNPIVAVWVDEGDELGLQHFESDPAEHDLLPVDDEDEDGVPAADDCDDGDPRVGALLYENDFSQFDPFLLNSPTRPAPWSFDGEANNSGAGQQALLGQGEGWGDTVTYGRVRVSAIKVSCGNNCQEDNTRFRAGYLARTTIDADQDEGFHGYRCAVAQNSGADCYDPGPFVQIGAFLDGAEDNIDSECVNGCAPNPTFDQLDREERSDDTDFIAGDSGELTFWAVGSQLVCEFHGNNGEHVVASAVDERFASGTTGLSTLNALSNFDYVRVCEAFDTP
jgi:hypothetical protein